jgi:hypothetical protein
MQTAEPGPRSSAGTLLRRGLFWEFARGSWQYDLIVAAILAFVFLMPREWFGDQPRGANVVLLSNDHGAQQMFLGATSLAGVPESERPHRAAELIRQKTGKRVNVIRVDPIRDDAEQELKGFIAYTSPSK